MYNTLSKFLRESKGVKLRVLPGVPDAREIRRELELILGSGVFRGSKRCQDFLRYVSTKALEGAAETLKERTLAIEVFGRHANRDLAEDSIVRVGAREVRKRLAQYYVAEGAHDQVRIDLPAGSYVPVFHYHEDVSESAPVTTIVHEPLPRESPPAIHLLKPSRGRRNFLLAGGLVGLTALSVLIWRLAGAPATGFDVFWAPAFKGTTPILLVLAHPIVYHPSSRASQIDNALNGVPNLPVERPIKVPRQLLDGSDMVPVVDQYVGFGDTVAVLRIATMLAQHSRYTSLRLASKVEFNDLRDSIPILIGAFTNRWTAEVTRGMRYRFTYQKQKPCFVDSRTGKVWALSSKTDNGRSTEDYVVICRLPHSMTREFMMIGAGLNVYGTEEAGRILASPDSLQPILRKLPKHWESKNLELILHVEVVGDAPAMPEMVAVNTW